MIRVGGLSSAASCSAGMHLHNCYSMHCHRAATSARVLTAAAAAAAVCWLCRGLQGLIPRASELLKLGASVFLAFVPLIVAISLMFGGIYYVFGDHFVHGGDRSYGRQTYYDPAELLSEPTADPYIPYQ